MSRNDIDPAAKLADDFKRKGYFDELKKTILSRSTGASESSTIEEFVRNRVSAVVGEMVNEDQSLISKNRGSTSALIEGQLLKNGYEKLNTIDLQIDSFLRRQLDDPEVKADLRSRLRKDLDTIVGPEPDSLKTRTNDAARNRS
ncbi:LADA_0E01002g1_1 [Lachancea dasiensis]|uniref:LADA_0E01002g1_1 n=1 Tax=Lachancea dasiensis TaxID=1072105 RepID=A0A1G4JAC4_9SACH|nr:LADA_0E01002g1_1 [Lachancea dasiensis]